MGKEGENWRNRRKLCLARARRANVLSMMTITRQTQSPRMPITMIHFTTHQRCRSLVNHYANHHSPMMPITTHS